MLGDLSGYLDTEKKLNKKFAKAEAEFNTESSYDELHKKSRELIHNILQFLNESEGKIFRIPKYKPYAKDVINNVINLFKEQGVILSHKYNYSFTYYDELHISLPKDWATRFFHEMLNY